MFPRQVIGGTAVCFVALLAFTQSSFADTPAKVDTAQPTPVVYPETAQRAGEEGTVVVSVYVNRRGKPLNASISKSSGFSDLDDAAVQTTMNWHFLPSVRGGDVASGWALVQVVYKLPEHPANWQH